MGLFARLREAFRPTQPSIGQLEIQLQEMATKLRLLKARASGVPINFGGFEYEKNVALKLTKRWETLDQMENDAHVKGALQGIMLPLLQAQWSVIPASSDARDAEIAEFVSANLLREGGDTYGSDYWCQTSWRAQRLPEILDMLRSGFAMFAKSFREVDGKFVYDRIQWLEPESVDPRGWMTDNVDNIVGIKRSFRLPSGEYEFQNPIPPSQVALYPWDLKGARYEGRPIIRSMYGAWHRKDFLQRMAMVWAQKIGSPVPYGTYPGAWDEDVIRSFEEFLQRLRGTAPVEAWGAFPVDEGQVVDVKYAGSEGQVDRMRSLIDGENAELSHVGASKSALLGETQTGARAVAEPMSRNEFLLLQAVAVTICEWENHGVANLPGLVQELVALNFANVTKFPKLVCSKVSPLEGLETLDSLIRAKQAGLVPGGAEISKLVVERLGYQLPDDVFEAMDAPSDIAGAPGSPPGEPPAQERPAGDPEEDPADIPAAEQDQQEATRIAASIDTFRQRIGTLLEPANVPGQGHRPQTRLEAKSVNLSAVSETFRVGERDVLAVLRKIRQSMQDEIVGRVRSGVITTRSIESQRRSRFRGTKKAKADLSAEVRKIADAGREHVQSEIEKQRGHV